MNFAKLQTSDSDNAADSFPMAILILVTERKMVKIMCFHLIASEKMWTVIKASSRNSPVFTAKQEKETIKKWGGGFEAQG